MKQQLSLTPPLVFFDLETTGVDAANDKIIEISLLKLFPDGREEVNTFRINPGIPIPAEATAIHGIKDEDVKDKPTFSGLAINSLSLWERVRVRAPAPYGIRPQPL